MTLNEQEKKLVNSARRELRAWVYLRWVYLAAVFGVFYYWMTLFESLSFDQMIVREVQYWRHAVILAAGMLGVWLFFNWGLPKERLITRLADEVDSNEHDTD